MRRLPLALALLVAGCTVGPTFEPPRPEMPAAYAPVPDDPVHSVPHPPVEAPVDVRWWDAFHDDELSALVARLTRGNLDLQAAAERIEQSRGARRIALAQGLPKLDGQGSYRRERLSETGTASLVEAAPGAPFEYDVFRTMLSASWELDLFGRVRRAVEAAGADVDAMTAARDAVALSAIAELVQDYCELRQQQALEAVLRRNLDIADQRRALVRQRIDSGVATRLEFEQADAQALAVAQDLPTLHVRQARLVNAMSLLLAESPRALADELRPYRPQPALPSPVPIGMPGELARRRPDVREAEARLHEATARTGVAVANFYPDVTLTGDYGFESLSFGTLFDHGSRRFSAGPAIDIPIFQGGRLVGLLQVRESQQREAALRFRRTLLQAWHEVDNALVAFVEAQHRRADVGRTNDADRRALRTADEQYRKGIATFLDVIDAQAAVLRSDSAIANEDAQVAFRLVDLYKALGGGWEGLSPGS